ncbi:MAG: hypothetical protein QXG65_03645 [Thermoplasmata archaeon]
MPVIFTRTGPTYTVSFVETGLPAVPWSVTFANQTVSGLAPVPLRFVVSNGTYLYELGNVPGWRASAYSGSVTVLGSNLTVSVSWALVTYAVTFLPVSLSGPIWGVLFNGTIQTTPSPGSIVFSAPNGTFTYQVQNVPGWRTTAYQGTITVNGTAITVSVPWTETTYTVEFLAVGAPVGSFWSVTLNGSQNGTTAGSMEFPMPNGTALYTVDAPRGWIAIPSSAYVTVAGRNVTVQIEFEQMTPGRYAVVFSESGLPNGTLWSVIVNGTTRGGTGSNLTFVMSNGTYAYRILGVSGWQTSSYTGTVAVHGGPTVVTVAWSRMLYPITFTEQGLSGPVWSVILNGMTRSAPSPSPIGFALPNGTYAYEIVPVAGWRATPSSGVLTVAGAPPAAIAVTFAQVVYTVTFEETGLPSGITWSIAINGTSLYARTGMPIVASLPNGTFTYLIGDVPGFHQTTLPYRGGGSVDGAALTMPTLVFRTYAAYTVTITEDGLPVGNGWTWSVVINGTLYTEPTGIPIVSAPLANGTFSYRIADIPGFHQSSVAYSGIGAITGSSVVYPLLAFVVYRDYTVQFAEVGLPSGSGETWTLLINGTTYTALTGDPITSAPLANGTYVWSITDFPGFHQSTVAYRGIGQVVGAPIMMPTLRFLPVTYSVDLAQSGLPIGNLWNVTINGVTQSSVDGVVSFRVQNGTFGYTVDPVGPWVPSPSAGSVEVAGNASTVALRFVWTSPLTFTQTGLSPSQTWSVVLTGPLPSNATRALDVTGSSVTIPLPNGTYAYRIQEPAGFRANPSQGILVLDGAGVHQVVVFTSIPNPLAAVFVVGWWWFVVLAITILAFVVYRGHRVHQSDPPRSSRQPRRPSGPQRP